MGVRELYILPGGFLTLDRSIFLTGVGMGEKTRAPVYAVLLIHDQGPILLDAGLNPDGLENPETAWGPRAKIIRPEFSKSDDIRSRLEELNLKVTDIQKVIITHLHWDHTGALRFFTHCPIVVQKAELRFAFYPDGNVAGQYMRNHFDYPLQFQPMEGDGVLLPGISVIKTPGHSPGHQSVIVKLDSGRFFIFPGDAIPIRENVDQRIPPSNNWNSEQAMDGISRLANLAELLSAELFPSHDISFWDSLRKSPQAYR